MRFHTSHLEFIFVAQLAAGGARGIVLSGCPSVRTYVRPGHSCARDISRTLQGMFLKFCTNDDSDWRMNWCDFGGRRSLQPRVLWTQHLNYAWEELLQSWFMGPLGLKDELITFWRSRSLWRWLLWKQYLKNSLRRFYKFGTAVNFDSMINWLHFGGKRSRSLWHQTL